MESIHKFDIIDFNNNIFKFLLKHITEDGFFKLTVNSDISSYSHCFGIFILNNVDKLSEFDRFFPTWGEYISNEIVLDADDVEFRFNKAKMQKLCFGLSALHLINGSSNEEVNKLVLKIINYDLEKFLINVGFYENKSQSANFCMFFLVLLLYCTEKLNIDKSKEISTLIELQLNKVDKNGFFNNDKFSHLSFQNFYHQFEIFEYLGIHIPNIENGIDKIISLYKYGTFHNAPYLGSSGCYDFDALSLVVTSKKVDLGYLYDFFDYILKQQNDDFGFSESKDVRPIKFNYFISGIYHILLSNNIYIFKERLKYFINYLLPKYSRINTHWTNYSRNWNESNLWDTWLKIQILYKILIVFDVSNSQKINFIDFPGMGYYKSKS
jgi:hypothetical protein